MSALETAGGTSFAPPGPTRSAGSPAVAAAEAPAAVTVLLAWAIPTLREGLPSDARVALMVTVLAMVGWVGTRVPESLVALAAGLAPALTRTVGEAQLFATLGTELVWLPLAAFLIAAVVRDAGLTERLVAPLTALRPTGRQLPYAAVCRHCPDGACNPPDIRPGRTAFAGVRRDPAASAGRARDAYGGTAVPDCDPVVGGRAAPRSGRLLVTVVRALVALTGPFTARKTKDLFRAVDMELILYRSAIVLIAQSRTGQVLVIDAGGRRDTAMIGDILSGHLQAKGVTGLFCDGAVRDTGTLGAWDDFPVFARWNTPRGPKGDRRWRSLAWRRRFGLEPRARPYAVRSGP